MGEADPIMANRLHDGNFMREQQAAIMNAVGGRLTLRADTSPGATFNEDFGGNGSAGHQFVSPISDPFFTATEQAALAGASHAPSAEQRTALLTAWNDATPGFRARYGNDSASYLRAAQGETTAERRAELEAEYASIPAEMRTGDLATVETYVASRQNERAVEVVREAVDARITSDYQLVQNYAGSNRAPTGEETAAADRLAARLTPKERSRDGGLGLSSGADLLGRARSSPAFFSVAEFDHQSAVDMVQDDVRSAMSPRPSWMSATERSRINAVLGTGRTPNAQQRAALSEMWNHMTADQRNILNLNSEDEFIAMACENRGSTPTFLEDSLSRLSRLTGAVYHAVGFTNGSANAKLNAMEQDLQRGVAVPIRVGNASGGHFMMATSTRTFGSPPTRQFLINDPWTGRATWASDAEMKNSAFIARIFPSGSTFKITDIYDPS